MVGQKLGEYTGATFIVENVPGAACILGTQNVARAQPDGYTLYLASSTPFATNPNFYKNLKYSLADFEPITLVARVPLILDVNPKFPASTVPEFMPTQRNSRTASRSPRRDAEASAKSSTA